MATSILERTPARAEREAVGGLARTLAMDATVPAVLFASAAIVVGLHWDIAWHRSIGSGARRISWSRSPPRWLASFAAGE
jgi:hypothetical protein